jgi:hypothetical protein
MAQSHQPPATHLSAHARIHHEESDVDFRSILMFGAGLLLTCLAVSFVVWVLFQHFEAREARQHAPDFPLATTEEHRLPPEPRLQTDPRGDLQALRDAEQQTLTTYGWVDRGANIVRLPIDEAMKLTVQRGLPARPGTGSRQGTGPRPGIGAQPSTGLQPETGVQAGAGR